MKILGGMFWVALLLVASSSVGCLSKREECTPTYGTIDPPLTLNIGALELSFSIVAVGCQERLDPVWPPPRKELESALVTELRDRHPVEIIFQINDDSTEIRRRVTAVLNNVLGGSVVNDVFLFKARAAE